MKFPEGTGAALKQIWQIIPGRDSEPDTLYCGVEPAALFVSRDAGDTWSLVEGSGIIRIGRAGSRAAAGSACTPSSPIREDHERIRIAISTAGMYVTDDGGANWRPSNSGVRAEFLPDKYPEFGQCVHKVAQSQQRPERMFLQNHWGLYRSDDRGETWTDIANGVPSDFGFRHGDPSATIADSRVDRAARIGRVPLHARGEAARLSHARRRRERGRR